MGIEFGRLLSFALGLGDMCLYALCLAGEGWVNCFSSMVSIAFYGINCLQLWYCLWYCLTMVLLSTMVNTKADRLSG